jgi:hypothetical protein
LLLDFQSLSYYSLMDWYSNLPVELRTFVTLPVAKASKEQSLRGLKLIKNFLLSSIKQQICSELKLLTTEF